MAFMDRFRPSRAGRSIQPDQRGIFPTHTPLKTLDNQELMAMFKKDISGSPAGAMMGGFASTGYSRGYRTGPTRMGKLQEAYGGTMDSVTWVFSCVSLIASTGAAYPWRLVNPNDGQTIETPPPDLVSTLDRPNQQWTYFDLVEAVLTDLELVGNCYLLRNELNKLGQPGSLMRLRPERVQIALNPDGTERGYVFSADKGFQIPYDFDEVMHFKYPSPLDEHYGMGTVEAIAPLLDRANAMGGHITGYFQNGARISGVLTIPQTMNDVAFERLKATYTEQFAGSAAAYKMLIAEGATDYKPITQGPAASGTVELLGVAKDEILSAFGVPEFLLGGAHQAGVEKMEEAQNIFLRAMIPRARRVAERITNDLALYWGVEFRVDPHANEPLSVRIGYAKEMIGAGATVNEAREAQGLDLSKDPKADQILVPSNLIPLDLSGAPPRPAPSMPMLARGESGAAGASGADGSPPPANLEEHLASLPAAIASGGGKDAVAALSQALAWHQHALEQLMAQKGASSNGDNGGGEDEGEDDDEEDEPPEVPPGPWSPIPALVNRINRGGKSVKYSPDQPRDDHGRFAGGGGGPSTDDSSGGGGTTTATAQVATPITADQARGNSRAVSADEFQQLAADGKARLDAMAQASMPTTGLDQNWEAIKSSAYDASQQSWGGATIDAHSGEALASNADMYALSVKPPGISTVSIPDNASAADFGAAMDQAKASFGGELQQGSRYLGVFRDDSMGQIQIDPVVVVDSTAAVEAIGAYTHAVGGAYHFASGDGYWPPHVGKGKSVTSLRSIEEALKAWGANSKTQTVEAPRTPTWSPPSLPRGFEQVTKATTTAQQELRDVQAQALRVGVDAFEPMFRDYFRDQRSRVIEALGAYGSTQRSARRRAAKAKGDLTPDAIFDKAAEDQALVDVYIPRLDAAVGHALETIPNAVALLETDPQKAIEALRTKLAGLVVRINETTRLAISDVVTEGLRRGYSISQIANGYADEQYPGIMGVFDNATAARAETIARTESAFAFNGTQVELYRANGVEAVEILDGTEFDEACAAADGQVWSLDDYEQNPIEHPNCSRSAIPSDKQPDGEDNGGT